MVLDCFGSFITLYKKIQKDRNPDFDGIMFFCTFCKSDVKAIGCKRAPCWINESVHLLVAMPKDYSFPSGHTQASFASATANLSCE